MATASSVPPTIRQYPSFNPQIPPEVPASTRAMPLAASVSTSGAVSL